MHERENSEEEKEKRSRQMESSTPEKQREHDAVRSKVNNDFKSTQNKHNGPVSARKEASKRWERSSFLIG
eukprot:scaffold1829_cov194-Ochromonas_danica.AAC.10